jgi:CubicO group peptidase (beta-lactamase class C family)
MSLPRTIEDALNAACAEGVIDAASLGVAGAVSLDIAAGHADARRHVPATSRTLFHIGSITKALTAELVRARIAAGDFDTDTPVLALAPELRRIHGLDGVTIAHLLTHSSGIDGDIMLDVGGGDDVLRRFLGRIGRLESLFLPGAGFSYANVGYALLGRVVELSGGSPYARALTAMLGSGGYRHALTPHEKLQHQVALAWEREGRGWSPVLPGPWSNLASGTMLAMAPGDLARWALNANRETAAIAIETPYSRRFEGWGHGWMVFARSPLVFGHDGGTAGTAAFLRVLPDAGTAWAFAATGRGAGAVYRKIEPLLYDLAGAAAPPLREPPGGLPGPVSRYVGRYARGHMVFDVAETEGGLVLRVGGDYADPLLDGRRLDPLTDRVCALPLPQLGAVMWVSFHDFGDDGRPLRILVGERAAVRVEVAP